MPAGEAAFPGAGGPWAAAPVPQFPADPRPLGCFPAPASRAPGSGGRGGRAAMQKHSRQQRGQRHGDGGLGAELPAAPRCALRAGGRGGSTTGWSWRCLGHGARHCRQETGRPRPPQHVLREPHPPLLTWSVVIGWQDCSLPASPAPLDLFYTMGCI